MVTADEVVVVSTAIELMRGYATVHLQGTSLRGLAMEVPAYSLTPLRPPLPIAS